MLSPDDAMEPSRSGAPRPHANAASRRAPLRPRGARRCSRGRSCGALVLSALLASGCATFRSAPPRFAEPWPPVTGGPRPAIGLTVRAGATEDGFPRDVGPILDLWGAETERAYRESALFADVALRPRRADVRIEVELHADIEEDPLLSVLSYLTLTIVPNVITTDIAMTTRASTEDGQPLGTIEVRGRSRTWWQLLLLPVMPFREPRRVTPAIVYDLNRESITALHSRGVF